MSKLSLIKEKSEKAVTPVVHYLSKNKISALTQRGAMSLLSECLWGTGLPKVEHTSYTEIVKNRIVLSYPIKLDEDSTLKSIMITTKDLVIAVVDALDLNGKIIEIFYLVDDEHFTVLDDTEII